MTRALTRVAVFLGAGLVAAVAVASPASAHTGHPAGGLADGLLHPVVGPDHLLAMLAVGVVAALVASGRLAWSVPAAFGGGMVLGGVAGIAGVSLPGVEAGVALSVVALGSVIAVGRRSRTVWLPVAAGLFGALHGLAHGGELPAGATPVAYVVGFVAATAGLHLLGAAAGRSLRPRASLRTGLGATLAAVGVLLLTSA
jgi:urease accessory protein